MPTHDVTNQPPPMPALDLFASDPALCGLVERFGGGWAADALHRSGCEAGSEEVQEQAALANRFGPELRTFDRFGHRVDRIEFHPSYHALMRSVFAAGVHCTGWTAPRAGRVAKAALQYVWNQADAGVICPAVMTGASLVVLRRAPPLRDALETGVLSRAYDPRPLPFEQKTGLTVGMAMTEKQGGSDLRAVATVAERCGDGPLGAADARTGPKWFCSAPMSGGFLTLARTGAGVTCFLVLRSREDGTCRFAIQRLKDKMGNRSNASAEIEYDRTEAVLVGEEGRGIASLIEMAHLTRLDAAVGSAANVRRALIEAIHHVRHRRAFGRALIDQPLMEAVLADMAVESEAMLALCLRAAAAMDRSADDPEQALLARFLVPLAKFWVCKRAPTLVAEAMECLGGNGYVEEGVMARLFREAPLNGIWEGPGNLMCLDMLRALQREPGLREAVLGEIGSARDEVSRLMDAALAHEGSARLLAERAAVALSCSLLERHAPASVSDLFRASRVALGAFAGRFDCRSVLDRAFAG